MPTNTAIGTVSTGNVGTAAWANSVANLNTNVGMYGTYSALAGSPPSANAPNFQHQAGTISTTPDGSGHVTITFPSAFSNGLLTFIAINGDIGAQSNMIVSGNQSGSAGTASSILVVCTNPTSGSAITTACRINWYAVGF